MTKYEVVTFYVETKNGKNAMLVRNEQSTQDEHIVGEYSTREEAESVYQGVYSGTRYMGGYYLHECKAINEVHYTEDGDFEYMDTAVYSAPDYEDEIEEDDEI